MMLFLIAILALLYTEPKKMEVDLILHNGLIYTVDSGFTIHEALAVQSGLIVRVGGNAEILNTYSAAKTINLEGKPMYPGFIDPHCHFLGYGRNLMYADLRNLNSFDAVLEKVKNFNPENTNGWIIGRGWDQNLWDVKEFPDCKVLDSLFPNNPVYLIRIDGHAALANTTALQMAGINPDTNVSGGLVQVKNNKCTGMLIDNAMTPVRNILPVNESQFIRNALINAQQNCFSVGLTSVQDAGLERFELDEIQFLQASGTLKMRLYAMLSAEKGTLEFYFSQPQIKTPLLHVGAVKAYSDGALGSRGAALLAPYNDDPDNSGFMFYSRDSLLHLAKQCIENGYQMCTHGIGDAGNRMILDVYAEVLKTKNDKRWRIEHCQVIHPADFQKFGQYSIIPSVQATHATSDMYWAYERLGGERLQYAYAYKKLLQQNGWIANGSDFPVEGINPLFGFYAAVVRKDQKGFPETGFQIENALSRMEALWAMTIWAAKAAFEENEKGSIEPGKYADFVVLEKDIMQIPDAEIFTTKVLMTFTGGELVYKLTD